MTDEEPTFSLCSLNRDERTEPFTQVDPVANASYVSELVGSKLRLPQGKFIIRSFLSGNGSPQVEPWTFALMQWKQKMVARFHAEGVVVHSETIDSEGVRKANHTESTFVEWLLDSNVHFILGHIHQGIVGLGWDLDILYKQQLPRLYYHPGFPSGKELFCPVFTQDKFRYLCVLAAKKYANPTLKIPLALLVDHEEEMEEDIKR
jgi:hypothetical protein